VTTRLYGSGHLGGDSELPSWAQPTPTPTEGSKEVLLGFLQRVEQASRTETVQWQMPNHGVLEEWDFTGNTPVKRERGIYIQGVFRAEDFERAEPALAKVVHALRVQTPVLVRHEAYLGSIAVGITFVIVLGEHGGEVITVQDIIDVVYGP